MSAYDLYINGRQMPTLAEDGLIVSTEHIWSSNTGRAANGLMIGDIIATKYKLQCKWNPLTKEEAALIHLAVFSKAFFQVSFFDPATNKQVTKTMYVGTPNYEVKTYNMKKPYHDVSFDLIEK